jgi:hypothetical protein
MEPITKTVKLQDKHLQPKISIYEMHSLAIEQRLKELKISTGVLDALEDRVGEPKIELIK